MDTIDKKILELLLEDSNRTATDIRDILHLSIPAINKRIGKLRSSGVIERFTIKINEKKIDKAVQAIVFLVLDNYTHADLLFKFVEQNSDIVECYAVTGEYDYLVKVYGKDIESIENILLSLKEKRCVAKSQTIFVLKEHKHLPGPFPG